MYFEMKYSIPSSVILQSIDDESLLMDENTQQFYELNSTGVVFWEVLQENNSFSEAFDELLACFDTSQEQLENDFNKFIDALKKYRMIEINEKI